MSSQRARRLPAWGILLLLCAASVLGQEGNVVIEHADSLVGLEINGEKARELIGNVRFRQGKVTDLPAGCSVSCLEKGHDGRRRRSL